MDVVFKMYNTVVKGNRLPKFLVVLSCVLSGLILGNNTLEAFSKLTLSDFHVYYYVTKAVMFLGRPEHPYGNFTPIYPYFIPPAFLLLFYPFALLPLYLSKIVWTVVNVSLLLSSIILTYKLINKKIAPMFWVLILAATLYYPVQFTLNDGQLNIVVLFLYAIVLYGISKHKQTITGLGIGLGIITKISPAIILLYLVYKRMFLKVIIITAIFLGALTLGAELFVKQGINYYYVRHVLSKVSNQSGGNAWTDQSLLALIKRVDLPINKMGESLLSYAFVGLALLCFIYVDRKSKKSNYNLYIDFSLLVTIAVIGTGLTWFHQYTMLLLPLFIFWLLSFRVTSNKASLLGIGFLIYLLTCFNLKGKLFGYLEFNMLYGAFILLLGLLYLKTHQDRIAEIDTDMSFNISTKAAVSIFLLFFVIGLKPFSFKEHLRESRDKARIQSIDYMGNVLVKKEVKFKAGTANSFTKSNKVDEGFILFADGENSKVYDKISILYIDPINNSDFNFSFESNSGTDVNLSSKLESDKYKAVYGETYIK